MSQESTAERIEGWYGARYAEQEGLPESVVLLRDAVDALLAAKLGSVILNPEPSDGGVDSDYESPDQGFQVVRRITDSGTSLSINLRPAEDSIRFSSSLALDKTGAITNAVCVVGGIAKGVPPEGIVGFIDSITRAIGVESV